MRMIVGDFWRGLAGYTQPPGDLVIDLAGDDLFGLWEAIADVGEADLPALGWSMESRRKVLEALMEYPLARRKDGHIVENDRVPVRLTEQDWKTVLGFCSIAKRQVAEQWPAHVTLRILAATAQTYPVAGAPRPA